MLDGIKHLWARGVFLFAKIVPVGSIIKANIDNG